MLIGVVTDKHIFTLRPLKAFSPACVVVPHSVLLNAMSGAASPTDVTAVSAQAGPTNVEFGPALAAHSEAPRLPGGFEPSVREPHREKNAWHPPRCIARRLSKKEMDSCPRARRALDAEWEKLRFLKRPHPVKGGGSWDEGNVREASSVREDARKAGKTIHFGRCVERRHGKGSELAGGAREEDEGSVRSPW